MHRILLAVDDSPAALAAARLAVELAAGWGAAVRAVTVLADHDVDAQMRAVLPAAHTTSLGERRRQAASGVLHHVTRLAIEAGVAVETVQVAGEPAPHILDQARSWQANLIVVGRTGTAGARQPYIGGQTRHVLEFSRTPVLVVPQPTEVDS